MALGLRIVATSEKTRISPLAASTACFWAFSFPFLSGALTSLTPLSLNDFTISSVLSLEQSDAIMISSFSLG